MMFNTLRAFVPPFLLVGVFAQAQGQDRAQGCFFSADFENGLIPAGWDIGPLVERQTSEGDSLDEFVPAWTVGTSAQANANGSFSVEDIPIGNHFVMANDDAPPCNCTMADVALTTTAIDLTGRTNVWLEGRLINPALAGGDTATIEVSMDGTIWDTVFVAPPVNDWIPIIADLSAYDGEPTVYLRFHWSDGGSWASGFALDDICLRERLPFDLSVIEVTTGGSASPFQTGDQTLEYTHLPLEQAGPLSPRVRILNRGLNAATGVSISFTATLNGTDVFSSPSIPVGDIPAGGPAQGWSIGTDWTPTALGELVVTMTVTATQDDDLTDNTGMDSMRITGAGWENGYGAMACDEGVMQGVVGGSNNFIAANRMEIVNEGSAAQGISGVITGSSQVGELVRAILMDATFTFVDTSLRHTLTQTDLDNGWVGEALYLPLSTTPTLSPGDYHVGMQRLTGTGEVFVATSGNGPIGASVLMEGSSFDITYLTGTPMVRLHLEDYGVGIAEQNQGGPQMRLYPVPANDLVSLRFELATATRVRIEIVDLMGRRLFSHDVGGLPAGEHTQRLSVGAFAAGSYSVRLMTGEVSSAQRLIIAR